MIHIHRKITIRTMTFAEWNMNIDSFLRRQISYFALELAIELNLTQK